MGNWMDSVVSDGMDGVMGDGVDSVVSDGVDSVVGDGVDCVVGNWSNSVVRDDGGLANWDGSVGSNGGLDLSQTLGVVGLGHGGVGGSEGLGLTEGSDLTVGGGDRLVGVLAGSHVVTHVVCEVVAGVGHQDGAGGGGTGHSQEGEADESLHICDLRVLVGVL